MAELQLLAADDIMPLDTELLEAVRIGGIAEIDAALARAPHDLGVRSHAYAWDALGLALAMGKLDLGEHLLAKGADPNSWDCHDATPLAAAVALPEALRAPAVALLSRYGVVVREGDLDTARSVGADLGLLVGLPRHEGDDDADDAGDAPRAPLPPLPTPREPPPPDDTSDLRVAGWLFTGAMLLIAALVLAIALFEWAGWV